MDSLYVVYIFANASGILTLINESTYWYVFELSKVKFKTVSRYSTSGTPAFDFHGVCLRVENM